MKWVPGTKKPVRAASPVVRQLFELIDDAGISLADAGRPAGVHYVTMSRWRQGFSAPRLVELENVAQGMGYRLLLVPDAE